MSSLTSGDLNDNNTALGALTSIAVLLHYIPILLSVDLSKRLPEDNVKEEAKAPLLEGSPGDRWARIAKNNSENLWQGVVVFIVATTFVRNGAAFQPIPFVTDSGPATRFLTAMMWIFLVSRIAYTICFRLAIQTPLPFRSIFWGFGTLSVLFGSFMIPYSLSQWYFPTLSM